MLVLLYIYLSVHHLSLSMHTKIIVGKTITNGAYGNIWKNMKLVSSPSAIGHMNKTVKDRITTIIIYCICIEAECVCVCIYILVRMLILLYWIEPLIKWWTKKTQKTTYYIIAKIYIGS